MRLCLERDITAKKGGRQKERVRAVILMGEDVDLPQSSSSESRTKGPSVALLLRNKLLRERKKRGGELIAGCSGGRGSPLGQDHRRSSICLGR